MGEADAFSVELDGAVLDRLAQASAAGRTHQLGGRLGERRCDQERLLSRPG